MQLAVLTLILATGAAGAPPASAPRYESSSYSASGAGGSSCDEGCDACDRQGRWRGRERGYDSSSMPQSCYNPAYGCYPCNERHAHRYPAFHGPYYRRPYNYRTALDYPWHSDFHEPTSHFSYEVPPQRRAEELENVGPPLPVPAPGAARRRVEPRPVIRRTSADRAPLPPPAAPRFRPVVQSGIILP